SPRLFEAAALRTGMVLFPGEYSGVVEPWRHYIPLEKDFSNFAEVAERIKDDSFLEQLTERTFEELIASGRYSEESFVRRFDDEMAARATQRYGIRKRHPRLGLRLEELSSGRGYHVSTLYSTARKVILAALGARQTVRSRALIHLARAAARTSAPGARQTQVRDDVFRLAVLRGFQDGGLRQTG